MPDETTNESNAEGKEPDKPVTDDKKDISKPDDTKKTDSQLLKEENDALEFELKRKQTIRNEALLAGTTGANVEVEPKEETPKEYNDRIEKEISEGKHND